MVKSYFSRLRSKRREWSARSQWRPVTQGEAAIACSVDLLLLLTVALGVWLLTDTGALWWILTLEVAVIQCLFLARLGRTLGLWVISATVVVPQDGVAPGIARAGMRTCMQAFLPLKVRAGSRRREAEDRVFLVDRLTGTLTLTQRVARVAAEVKKKKDNPWLTVSNSGGSRQLAPSTGQQQRPVAMHTALPLSGQDS